MSSAIEAPILPEAAERTVAVGRRRPWRSLGYALVLPVLAVVTWQSVVYFKLLPTLLFPSLITVASTTLDTLTGYSGGADWYSGKWFVQAAATTQRVLV